MGYWVEIVCDTCKEIGTGFYVVPGQSFARRLEAHLRDEQRGPKRWLRTWDADGFPVHTCPLCLRLQPPKEE